MSAVDCIKHIHIGYFNENIGIYWPSLKEKLSKVTENKKEKNIEISPYTLLIGGGSGEHQAMHIVNDAAVLHFFCLGYNFENFEIIEQELLEKANSDIDISNFYKKLERLSAEYFLNEDEREDRWGWNIDQNHWPIETFLNVKKDFEAVGLLDVEGLDMKFNKVLLDLFGAIIIEKLPIESIEDEKIKEIVVLFKAHKEKLLPYMLPDYMEKLMLFFEDQVNE